MKKSVVKQLLLFRIMKITLFQLLLAFVFSTVTLANSVNGQKKLETKVTLNIENLTLYNALVKLEKTAKVKFSYNSRISQLNKKISYKANNELLSSVLSNILQPLNITFSEVSNQIILQNNTSQVQVNATKAIHASDALNRTSFTPIVKGKVLDERGNPLYGANVLAKGTKAVVLTDFDGTFTIDMPGNTSILVVSYIGMETKEVEIQETSMTIILSEIGQNLNEVIVTTGYEKISKRTFTGAVSAISGKDLLIEGVVDISRMIEGKAAGVTVQNVTGTFGAAPRIIVRGSSSVFGDTKPLWVIDGIVQEDIVHFSFADLVSGNSETVLTSSIAGLNPNDVLSIEILKDASATSIYGSRSLNGVVVVTTKQGKRESPLNITYSLEQTARVVPSYNQYNILNSQETMGILKEIEGKGFLGLPDTAQGRYGGVYNILANEINTYNTTGGTFGVKNDEQSRNAFLRKYELANTNWFKTLFRPSITQNHSLSFSGGGKNNTYFASLGFYHDPGWTVADKVNQLTSNIKNTFYVNDKLNLTLSTQASVRDQSAPGTYSSSKDGVNGRSTSRDFDINPFNYALNTNRTLRPYDDNGNYEYYRNNWAPINIVEELKNNYMDIKVKDIRFQADLAYDITPKLTYNFTANARYANTTREHNILEKSNIVGAYNAQESTIVRNANIFLYQNPDDLTAPKISVLPNGGILRKFSNELTSYNIRNSFNYKNVFNNTHEFEGLFGQEIRSVNRNGNNFTAYGLQYDKGFTAFTDPRILEKLINGGESYYGFNEERERTVGFFGKVGYTYDRRYTGSITGRYDGSNRQGSSNSSRWLPTYTFSGKWNIMEEDFMENVTTAINNLSLRGSYGLTATAGPATNSLPIYKNFITSHLSLGDRETGLNIADLQNTDLTWEKQFETNIGLDLGLFNRVQFTTDIYSRKAFDLVDYVTTSGIGGQKLKLGNNADMETKGIEVSLVTRNLKETRLKWTTSFNFSVYDQKITKLQNKPSVLGLVDGTGGNALGNPRNALYSYQFTGLNNQGLPTFIMADGQMDNVTGANFEDSENVTKYLKYEGSIEPNKSAGISNTFTYDNWSLNIFIVAAGGNKVRLNPIYSARYDDLTVFTKEFTNRWINPGDEAFTNIPVIANSQSGNLSKAYNAYNFSDQRVADGSFVRLKNVSLSYEFPKTLKKKLGVDAFSLKGSTANPLLIYSDKKLNGQDPEFYRSGGVSQPITSQYTFSINTTF
ncbi:SusC/RagA family TonB-linked outer membrane protein [Flavobacterium piscis]|uniref:TonB-linked SusC/RagA family outer membrane protein n=1 Tax=Flavobacterium piscis TaxID=1114874 RepID=A0ABU1Y583_9FLAO|nr:SusC/RagA family TonB-linked outer membrane protein [Flavobacterium piscis]MDR7209382.1 TonB-linked SusC/RagA family outer membrane protein [Flavobacterium piscis]